MKTQTNQADSYVFKKQKAIFSLYLGFSSLSLCMHLAEVTEISQLTTAVTKSGHMPLMVQKPPVEDGLPWGRLPS